MESNETTSQKTRSEKDVIIDNYSDYAAYLSIRNKRIRLFLVIFTATVFIILSSSLIIIGAIGIFFIFLFHCFKSISRTAFWVPTY